ncbi:hypothetical protein [Bacteroides uniformis]|jgi:hypothetical protein|uniref:hypothetical protein n=1 Tax=Bacteroides uniformis TaxID=820 RepID=UPI0006C1A1C2|nr:hypothetical protein [Bacteroides uniformis]CUN76106.1 Uncharacterised protein [Bacteroides uniformis]
MDEQQKTEDTVVFKADDRMTYGAMNYDGTELMAVISGYDLNIAFNMRTINSLADAEAAANALADVFYEVLMEQLIEEKSYLVKPSGEEKTIP